MEGAERFAPLKGAQIFLYKVECAISMGQRGRHAAVKDVQIKPSMEECVQDTGHKLNGAAVKVHE